MTKGELYINGTVVPRERAEDFVTTSADGEVMRVKRWKETLPEGAVYETLDLVDNAFYDNTPVHEVPTGHYFVMGDNRDNSSDSRASGVGYVPYANLIGPATLAYFSVTDNRASAFWRWPWTARWDRVFVPLRHP
jgi:signal peptidase I